MFTQVKSAPGAGGTKVDELVPLAELTSRLATLLSPHGWPSQALGSLATSPAAAGAAAAAVLGTERGFFCPPGVLPEGVCNDEGRCNTQCYSVRVCVEGSGACVSLGVAWILMQELVMLINMLHPLDRQLQLQKLPRESYYVT